MTFFAIFLYIISYFINFVNRFCTLYRFPKINNWYSSFYEQKQGCMVEPCSLQSVKKVPSSQRASRLKSSVGIPIALSSILPQLKACRRTAGLFSWLRVAPSAHIGGFAPYNPQYIAKKHSAGGRGRVRQHPTPFPLPFGEGVRGWGKFKLTNTFSTSSAGQNFCPASSCFFSHSVL